MQVKLDCDLKYRLNMGQAAMMRPATAMETDHMKPTKPRALFWADIIEAAIGCAVLFGLLALGLWVTP